LLLGESGAAAAAPAMEIIDSRYRDFRFNLPGVIADNTSASAFVVGDWTRVEPGDARPDALADLPVQLAVDGTVVEKGSTAAILGHPLHALDELIRIAADRRIPLTSGDIVLAGAATASVSFTASSFETTVEGLGSVTVRGENG
jgi:2-oxo-3-hexenedioate decarboxylase